MQKLSSSYEHVDPTLVGNRQTIVVSDLSGQSNVLAKTRELGLVLEKGAPEVVKTLAEIKRLENEGYEFEAADGSFDLLVRKTLGIWRPLFDLKEYHCTFRHAPLHGASAHSPGGQVNTCEATVKLLVEGTPEYTVAEGDAR